MRIFVDMDGVLADFDGAMDVHLLDRGWTVENRTEWSLSKRIGRVSGAPNTREEASRIVNQIMDSGSFWSEIKPIEGGLEVVKRWIKTLKHLEVFVATSPWMTSPYSAYQKVVWLQKNLHELPLSNIVMTSQKHLLRGDVIIDDKPEYIINWLGSHAIVYTQPWNREIKVEKTAEKMYWRAYNWTDVDNIVDFIGGKEERRMLREMELDGSTI